MMDIYTLNFNHKLVEIHRQSLCTEGKQFQQKQSIHSSHLYVQKRT